MQGWAQTLTGYRGNDMIMNGRGISALAAALAAACTVPAGAITVATRADVTLSLAAARYTGVGSLGTLGQDGAPVPSCTGSLVATNVVLTAAHCLGDARDPSRRFFLPATGDYVPGRDTAFGIAGSMIVKSYLGTGADTDLALVTLDSRAFGHTIYDIYTDRDEVGQVATLVGAGFSGLMSEGFNVTDSDGRLREGRNRYDMTGDRLDGFGYGDDVLVMDNDSGLDVNDLFGRYYGVRDLGVFENGRLVEAGLIFGDSGGPDFLAGKIAGVHSFAGSGSFLETDGNGCGRPGSADTVADTGFGCTDGSYGDLAGSVRVSFYAAEIRAYIAAAAVPEPTSWAMMIAGFGVAGAAVRRRRTSVALS